MTIEFIKETVAEFFGYKPEIIDYPVRKRELVFIRQIAHYLSRKHTEFPFSDIGLVIGDKDHTTVMFSCRTIQNLIDTDYKYKGYPIREIIKHIEDVLFKDEIPKEINYEVTYECEFLMC